LGLHCRRDRDLGCFTCCAFLITPGPIPPRQKSTLPSVPVGVGATVAVSVTVWPVRAVTGEAASVVVVGVMGCTPVPVKLMFCVAEANGPRLLSDNARAFSKPPAVAGSN